jgi:hypothetical protein
MSLAACTSGDADRDRANTDRAASDISARLAKYTPVRLTTDLSALSDQERQMIPLLIDAAQEMDDIFWQQAYGNREQLMNSIEDPDTRRFVEINYGPWDRLANNEPFVPGVGPKPPGSNLYPSDITKEEFERAVAAGSNSSFVMSDG